MCIPWIVEAWGTLLAEFTLQEGRCSVASESASCRFSRDDVVLVALTGYGRAADVQATKAAGFDSHVTKPADVQALQEILANGVQRQKAS